MRAIKIWLDKYFDFSKREFNGLMVLIILIGITMVFPYLYDWILPYEHDGRADRLAIQKLSLLEKQSSPYYKEKNSTEKEEKQPRARLFTFDPNTVNVKDWQKLGLSLKQAQSIIKYRSKGGRFFKTEDLRKMYTVSAAMYARLAPFVKIENQLKKGKYPYRQDVKDKNVFVAKTRFIVEINGADTLLLDQIKGIGPAFARRIVKYRTRLGGFCRKEQLMEIFGLDSLIYKEVKDQVSVDVNFIKKVNINTAEMDDFKNHPYIRYKQVNALLQYRIQHGNYRNIDDLKKVAILTPEIIAQLAPYLSF